MPEVSMSRPIGGRSPQANLLLLSEAQKNLHPDASPQQIEQANNEALEATIDASFFHDEGLTAKQKFARESGDPDLIHEADDEALAQGIQASMDPANDVPKSPRTSIPEEEIAAQRGIIARLKEWIKTHGFAIKTNNGNQHNCLIISMLQHATGNYESSHEDRARFYKQKIVEWSKGKEKSSSALHSDDELFRKLIDEINKHYFNDCKDQYLRFKIVTADLHGEPTVREIGEGPRVAGIIDGGGHYEAYVKNDATQ
jgi:hypothetical protein